MFSKNPLAFVAYGVAIVLIFLTMHFYNESRDYKIRVDNAITQIKMQNQNMQVLMNNQLPEAVINAQLDNPVIVRASL
ncbi:MAG: hypothetical protein JEY94_15540 [Melioribacteraceae bacterium]|nr:hypothetical protein [Melioribacteraceae bacterium]